MNDPIRLFSAGSLRHALPAIIAAFEGAGSAPVALTLGPAGLLRERIEAGAPFDLFASADMGHPRRLAAIGLAEEPVRFARNRLCILARADLGLSQTNFLEILSNPTLRIGTSTPGDDPGGDYAMQMFDRIEAAHPGTGAGLKTRAKPLLGGRNSPSGKDSGALIAEGVVDAFLGYSTSARRHAADPALCIVEVPPEYAPRIDYGLAIRKNANLNIRAFRDHLLSASVQTLLEDAGFAPLDEDQVGSPIR